MGSPDHHGTGADRRHVSETLSDSDGITEEDADVVEEEEKTVREWLTVVRLLSYPNSMASRYISPSCA